jgi:hypothetical protein
MKIKDIFTQYEKCKLCNLNNIAIFRKHKEPLTGSKKLTDKKSHYTKDIIDVIDDNIVITEEGSYHTEISKLIIDINNNICQGSEVSRYEYTPFFLSIKMCCQKQISREYDYGDEDFGLKKLYEENNRRDISDNTHYSVAFEIQIDQKAKEIIGIDKMEEVCETSDFLYEKNYVDNKTKIIRKQKVVSLPFILEKDLKDFNFESVLNNTSLLK